MNNIRFFVPPAILVFGVVIVNILAATEAISPGLASACMGIVYLVTLGAGIVVYRKRRD